MNEIGSLENIAYLIKYDTVYGRYRKDVEAADGALVVEGDTQEAGGPLYGQDALRVVKWDAHGSFGALQGAPLRVRVLLDTSTGQDTRGESRGVLDRGCRSRRPGEDAHRSGESRSWSGAAIAGRERLDRGLEGFQEAGLDCAPGSSRNEAGTGRGRPSGADYEPPDALPKIGWRFWLLTTLAERSCPKVDMVLAAGLSRSTTSIDPTLDVASPPIVIYIHREC